MFQPDLFSAEALTDVGPSDESEALDLPGILDRLTRHCARPRYSFMVLNLIAQAAVGSGEAGPYVCKGDRRIPIRDWLCDALAPVSQRDPRRLAIAGKVRAELERQQLLPHDERAAEQIIAAHVRRRIQLSGRTNVSRAVSELVRAGLLRRYYQGYRVDHQNRGAQRQAVYSVSAETRNALRSS